MFWSIPIKPSLFNKIALINLILLFCIWKYIELDKLIIVDVF